MSPTGFLTLLSLSTLWGGERLFHDGALHWPLTGAGILLMSAAFGVRFNEQTQERDPSRQEAQRYTLYSGVTLLLSGLLYATTTPGGNALLGLIDTAANRWNGAITVCWLILGVLALGPLLQLERLLASSPVMLPQNSPVKASQSGLSMALAVALIFPVNYLGTMHATQIDYAYFKTTRAGDSTLALVRSLAEPVHATLFFSAGSDVRDQVIPYFQTLTDSAPDTFSFEVIDQALVPEMAKELQITDNGYISLVSGDVKEKFKIGTEVKKAKRDLKKLDSTVQKKLLSLSRGKRVAYTLTGHGEASARMRDQPLLKTFQFKKLLQSQNFEVKTLGITTGSTDRVPDDASLLIIAGPTKPLLTEEFESIQAYLHQGGRLLILHEFSPKLTKLNEAHPLSMLYDILGVTVGKYPLMHQSKALRKSGQQSDRLLLATNRFGKHAAVRDLNRHASELLVFSPTVVAISETDGQTVGRISPLLRSFPDTWEETNFNLIKDPDEKGATFNFGVAIEPNANEDGQMKPFRAVVMGDVSLISDYGLQQFKGNERFTSDIIRWLVGDEDLIGGTENEADVKIQHTREEDVMWFYGILFGMPGLILLAGLVSVRLRRTS